MATKKKALKKSKLRHAEYYDFQKIQDKLYAESMDGKMFTKLVEIITLPEAEKRMIEEKMTQAGMTNLSAYLRRIAIDGMIVRVELPELKEMVSLLRYASNNINQIARRMNESGRVYGTDLEQVVQNQEQLWDMANGILVKLAGIK